MGLVDEFLKKIGFGVVSPLPDNPGEVKGVAIQATPTNGPKIQEYIKRMRNEHPELDSTSDEELRYSFLRYGPHVVPNPKKTPTPEPGQRGYTPATGPVLEDVDKFIEGTVLPVTRKYGIPDAVAAAQFAAEGRNVGGLGSSRNNYFNLGAVDSNPDQAFGFDTPEAGVEAYAKFISGEGSYPSEEHKKRFEKAYQYRNDPRKMLKEIENAGYAGDPKTYSQRAANDFRSYADFAMSTPEWAKYSKIP